MSAPGATPPPHLIGVLMSPEGHFLECATCRLRVEFPHGAHFNTISKQFCILFVRLGSPAERRLLEVVIAKLENTAPRLTAYCPLS